MMKNKNKLSLKKRGSEKKELRECVNNKQECWLILKLRKIKKKNKSKNKSLSMKKLWLKQENKLSKISKIFQ